MTARWTTDIRPTRRSEGQEDRIPVSMHCGYDGCCEHIEAVLSPKTFSMEFLWLVHRIIAHYIMHETAQHKPEEHLV